MGDCMAGPASSAHKQVIRGEIVAIGIYLFAQFCATVWWAAEMNQRITNVEDSLREARNDHALIQRLDERTDNMKYTLNHVDQLLEEEQHDPRRKKQ